MAAVGAGVANDELQLLAGVLHKLALEGPLLGLGGPGQTLIDIEEAIEAKGEGDESPSHGLPHLHRHSSQRVQPSAVPPPSFLACCCQDFPRSIKRPFFVPLLRTRLSTSSWAPPTPEGQGFSLAGK